MFACNIYRGKNLLYKCYTEDRYVWIKKAARQGGQSSLLAEVAEGAEGHDSLTRNAPGLVRLGRADSEPLGVLSNHFTFQSSTRGKHHFHKFVELNLVVHVIPPTIVASCCVRVDWEVLKIGLLPYIIIA